MTALGERDLVTGAAQRDESVATQGARWITVAFVIMGLLNYGYALVLTRLLDVAGYSSFVAGQGLILWATTVATVSVPWVLAQSIVRAGSAAEQEAAIRFSKLAAFGSGVIAAAVVGIIAARFGGSLAALAVALSTLVIFLGTTTTGWLQGKQRMRTLSALYVGENVLKNLAGLLLVTVAGLRETGALSAFGIGGLVLLLWRPRARRGTGGPWLTAMANRDLWARTLRFAGMQGLISLFVVTDVVLVALLPGDRALAASYQASAALSRAPVFIAGAVGMAFFPLLSRHTTGGLIAARALRMYTAVALPLCAVLATMPAPLLAVVFPAKYAAIATLLKFTALAGLAVGGISLVSAFFQAANDFSCLPWLGTGLAAYVATLLAGWWIGGITGLAAGGSLGALATLILLGYRLVRREGGELLARIPLLEPAAAAGMLILLRAHAVLWLVAAAVIGVRAGVRFFRPVGPIERPDAGLPVELPTSLFARPGIGNANGWHQPGRAGSVAQKAALGAPLVLARSDGNGGPLSHQRGGVTVSRPGDTVAAAPVPPVRRVVISSFDSPGNPCYGGGGAAVVERIAGWLASDFDVTVVTAAHRSGTVLRDGVRHRHLPVGRAGPRAGQLLFHALLPFAARRIPHDLWIESFTPPFSTSFLPLFSRAPVVGFAQSLSGEEMWARYRLPFFLIERFGLRFYRDVVVLNPADGARVRRYSPSATVRVIPNCIDMPPLGERLPGCGEHILFLGRIDIQEKGLDLLLAAYRRSGLAMPLLVAGAGTRREERKLAAMLAATGGDVRWLGHVTGQQKQELLKGSAFVVLPSRHESFGLAALEAMACGKPVLHFDLPSLRWMCGDLRVPPFDTGVLADKMRELGDDKTVQRRLGRAAQAAARRHGPAETAGRYVTLVQQLLDAPGAGTLPGRPHRVHPGSRLFRARRWHLPSRPDWLLRFQHDGRWREGEGVKRLASLNGDRAPAAAAQPRVSAQAVAAVSSIVGAVTLAIRLALHGSSFDLFGDEVIYTDIGRSVINGGFPRFGGGLFFLHGPGFFYLDAGWARLLGGQHSLVSWIYEMRTLNAVLAAITAVALVHLAARAASLWAGTAAGLLFALDPFCIRQNDRVLLETAMMLWVVLGYVVFTSLTGESRPFSGRFPSPGAAARAVGAGLLFGLAVLTKDEAALLTLLPLLASAALRWGPARALTMLTVGATMLPYLVYLTVVAANGHFGALWVAKTAGLQRMLGITQVTGFHSHGGGSLPARLIAEGAYFGTTYVTLVLAVPAVLLLLRRGGQLPRILGLLYCAAAVALGYALVLGTLEEQELYLLIVPSLLTIPVAVSLWRGARLARTRPAASTASAARASRWATLTAALMLVLSINLVTCAQWFRQPDDGVAQLLSYLAAHVPAHTRIAAAAGAETVVYALDDRYDVEPWVPSAAGSQEQVRYVVVPWAAITEGYSNLTASQVRHFLRHGRMVFSFYGRTYGDLALYRQPLKPEP